MNFLKEIRENRDITQKQLAYELGISQSALSQIENRTKIPSMKNFLMLVHLKYINESNMYTIVQEWLNLQWRE